MEHQDSASPLTKVRAHLWIRGRVQGVFYRASTQRMAAQWGVNGWVRNLPDGRVEAVFEGDRSQVDQMIAWCHQGPPEAAVTEVVVSWESFQQEPGFQVRH